MPAPKRVQTCTVMGRYSDVINDLEPLVTARQLLRQDVGVDVIVERLQQQFSLETREADAAVAAARALVEYEALRQALH